MARPEIHAARAMLDYHATDRIIGGLAEDTNELAEQLAAADPQTRQAFKIALPELSALRRRLLTTAAAIGRLQNRIED
jgi:hypothetical protein